MKILVITPCGRESGIIKKHHGNLLDAIEQCNKKNSINFDIAYIIDSYTDIDTVKILSHMRDESSNVFILEKDESKYTGLAGCYLQGYSFSVENEYDYVLEFDIESHEYSKICCFVESAITGKKAIFGTRNKAKSNSSVSLKRKIISSFGTLLSKRLLKLQTSDNTSGFQMFSVEIVKKINLLNFVSSSYFFQTEMKYKIMLYLKKDEYEEIPFNYVNSKTGLNYKNLFLSFIEFVYVFTHR